MTDSATTRVSIIAPCRNEAPHIRAFMDSLLAQECEGLDLEILIVDGLSEDGTAEVVAEYATKHPRIRLITNEKRITPAALNRGIEEAHGEVIVRMDAHSVYPTDYVARCIGHLRSRPDVGNVGGRWVTLPGADTVTARAIAAALSHPFGVGNATYRVGAQEPCLVDTVPFGCYRREVFDRIGRFDEEMVRNQDDEFNARLTRSGGRHLLVPAIEIQYFARDTLPRLWRMIWQYGLFKPLAAVKAGTVPTLRQLVPAAFVASVVLSAVASIWFETGRWALVGILGLYLAANAAASVAASRGRIAVALLLPIVFAGMHISYGVGYWWGLVRFVLLRRRKQDMSLSR
jgi:glycosyltransferase involved in cell wall biosynthesis